MAMTTTVWKTENGNSFCSWMPDVEYYEDVNHGMTRVTEKEFECSSCWGKCTDGIAHDFTGVEGICYYLCQVCASKEVVIADDDEDYDEYDYSHTRSKEERRRCIHQPKPDAPCHKDFLIFSKKDHQTNTKEKSDKSTASSSTSIEEDNTNAKKKGEEVVIYIQKEEVPNNKKKTIAVVLSEFYSQLSKNIQTLRGHEIIELSNFCTRYWFCSTCDRWSFPCFVRNDECCWSSSRRNDDRGIFPNAFTCHHDVSILLQAIPLYCVENVMEGCPYYWVRKANRAWEIKDYMMKYRRSCCRTMTELLDFCEAQVYLQQQQHDDDDDDQLKQQIAFARRVIYFCRNYKGDDVMEFPKYLISKFGPRTIFLRPTPQFCQRLEQINKTARHKEKELQLELKRQRQEEEAREEEKKKKKKRQRIKGNAGMVAVSAEEDSIIGLELSLEIVTP